MRSKKRAFAAVMAVLLAALGIGALVVYTKGAQDRAFAGRETVSVLRVTETVPVGTKASDLGGKLERVKLPRAAVPDDAVQSVDGLGDKTTTATLVPGEVLVAARFVRTPGAKGAPAIAVPDGLQELTVELSSARVIGGSLQPGDRVGVVASYDPERFTNFAANRVLVLDVSGETAAASGGGDSSAAPSGAVIQVRLALNSDAVERVVNASEFGKVWLSRQNSGAVTARKFIEPEGVVK